MINRIIDLCGKNKVMVLILAACAVAVGIWAMRSIPLDALPDLSDTQVIVYSRWDRSPDIMEDQVTYPIVTAMLGAPKVKDIRGFSDFGYSYVYIIFQEGTDIYWARSRTLEYLSSVLPRLPQGVTTELGPDATGVGWVFQYALVDKSGTHSLAELRSLQDWFLRYQLRAVPGVAEVAPIGGFVRQYQVNVDPNRLQAYNVPIMKVVEAVRGGNNDVGGRLVEFSGAEYMVRGRGYARSEEDIGKIVVGSMNGVPVRVQDLGTVTLGPDIRRGLADLDGTGDTVAGIVVMRQGENALQVIERVKAKLQDIEPGLPKGVKIVSTYDRSDLILRSIENLKETLLEEMIIVAVVIFIFLLHAPSALVPVVTIPVAVAIAFIPMQMMGLTSNVMSLGGIAIAIGAMVDASIVVVEQTHKKLEAWEREGEKQDYHAVVIEAAKEVAGPSFFALLVIAVSFIPVLTLEAQEGRLFKPLAFTKNFSMAIAALLAITLYALTCGRSRMAHATAGLLIVILLVTAQPTTHLAIAASLRRTHGPLDPDWRTLDLPRAHGALFHARDARVAEIVQQYAASHLQPGETFFDFTNRGGLYFLLDRDCPIRQIEVAFYEPEERQRDVIARLERNRAIRFALIPPQNDSTYVDGVPNATRAPLVWAWLQQHFSPDHEEDGVVFWRRNDAQPPALLR